MSKQTSKALKREIAKSTDRRAELAARLETAKQAHDEAQAQLLAEGTDGATDRAATAFATYGGLREAINTLDEKIVNQQEILREAARRESLKAAHERRTACQLEMDQAEIEFREGRARANQALIDLLTPTMAAWQRFAGLQKELKQLNRVTGAPGTLREGMNRVEHLEPFGRLIGAGLELLLTVERQGSRAERKAKANEVSRREARARALHNDMRNKKESDANVTLIDRDTSRTVIRSLGLN